jgi:hypothetical protein
MGSFPITIKFDSLGWRMEYITGFINLLVSYLNCPIKCFCPNEWHFYHVLGAGKNISNTIIDNITFYRYGGVFKYQPFYSNFWYFGVTENHKFYSIQAYYSIEYLTLIQSYRFEQNIYTYMNTLVQLDNTYMGYEWLTELHCQFLLSEVLTDRKYLNTAQILYIDAFIKLACQKVSVVYPPEPDFWLLVQNTIEIQHAFLGSHVSDTIFNPLINPNNCLVSLHSDMSWNTMCDIINMADNSPGNYIYPYGYGNSPYLNEFYNYTPPNEEVFRRDFIANVCKRCLP